MITGLIVLALGVLLLIAGLCAVGWFIAIGDPDTEDDDMEFNFP